MTREIVARVDAWIEARTRKGAPSASNLAYALMAAWSDARMSWRCAGLAGNTEERVAALAASLRGILLDLVRDAWGCDQWRRLTVEPAGGGWCIVLRNGRHRPPSRAQEGWTLDPAVHMRYVSEIDRGPFGRNEYATEDEALACALEAAPRREAAP